jgi:amiloride-sensitive sodium channel
MPNEVPTTFHELTFLEISFQKVLFLHPKSFRTNENMKKFQPKIRGCYFENERKLKFFKIYTKAHCDLECMTNFTLKFCGCVHFSMPRTLNDKVCDLDEILCVWKIFKTFPNENATTCGCLESCNYMKYELQHAIENLYGKSEDSL